MKEALYCKRKLIVIISIMMAFICMPCIALAEDSAPTEYGAGVSDTGMEQTPLEFFLENNSKTVKQQNAVRKSAAKNADATIYAMDDYDGITIPEDYPQSYQISIPGATIQRCTVIEGDSVKVTSRGLVTPRKEVWYYSGNGFWTTTPIAGAETDESYSFGESKILVNTSAGQYTVTVAVENYAVVYAETVLDEYFESAITNGMTDLEIIREITRYTAEEYDYGTNASGYVGMVITGAGDCWASTSMIVYLAKKAGMQAWSRNANMDGGAGSGHMNALIKAGKNYYIAEAGYSMSKPRYYYVAELQSLFTPNGQYSPQGGIELIQYEGHDDANTSLIIPSAVNGNAVIGIGEKFGYRSYECEQWKEIHLPDTVQYLDNSAFNSVINLETINIPASVERIGQFAFTACDNLRSINVDSENPNFSASDGVLYSKDGKTLLSAPGSTTGVIRDGVEEIGDYAFYYNKKNSQYTVPSSVRKIGLGAFGDTGANSIVFQGDMPEIGEYAFANDDITVYYPAGNNTWNTENSYKASSIEWVPYNTESINIDNCTVTLDKSKYRRTGEQVKPKVTVQAGTETLTQGTDYSVRYSNNWNIGKGKIIITGKGRFFDAKTVYFDIIPRLEFYYDDVMCVPKDDTCSLYFIPDDEVEQNLTYEIGDPSIAEVVNDDSWQDDQMLKVKGLKAGTTRLTLNDGLGDPVVCEIEVEDWGSGYDSEISIYDVITHASVKDVIYNGKRQEPALNLQFRSGMNLVEGRDYEVEYTDNKNVGMADVWIYGIGDYYDVMLLEFKINPQGTTIKKVKKGKKSAKVKWNIQTAKMSKSYVTGYQIRYSRNSTFKSSKKVTVKGYKSASKKIKKLKGKKVYYFQIRTYMTVYGDRYYSPWSPAKRVKVKK